MNRPRPGGLATRLLFGAGVATLSFLLGTWVAWRNTFPYRPQLRRAYISAETLARIARARLRGERPAASAADLPGVPRGVTRLEPQRVSPGLTLVLAEHRAHLIDFAGKVRHSWSMPDADVPSDTYWRKARILEGGDLLVLSSRRDEAEGGWQLLRLDRDSRPRWSFRSPVHHDFDLTPDGRILVLDQVLRDEPPAGLAFFPGPLLDERVLVLSPEGKLLRTVSILEGLARSPYRVRLARYVGRLDKPAGDYLHSNNIDVADAAVAARFSFVKEGQVLLSFRNIHMLAVMDLETETVTWLRQGEWVRQHDPDFLENGNLLIFDNHGDWERRGGSRVIEYDPRTSSIVWQYPGETGDLLYSDIRGDQQVLANGNLLVNEFGRRRLIEITRAGEIVWEYWSPFVPRDHPGRLLRLYDAQRYPPEELDFLGAGAAGPG